MPPWTGVAGQMAVSLVPPNGDAGLLQDWNSIGAWVDRLTQDRRQVSPQMRQKVTELTASVPTLLGRIQALASYVQSDVRYVAIELGIGGYQPHTAAEIFNHHYGDCKDKATLLGAMLKEIGVDSHYVYINTVRGSITPQSPPNLGFDHAILAVVVPADVDDSMLQGIKTDPRLGKLLFFDPTDEMTTFGRLSGRLQANYGLVIASDGSQLMELPRLSADANTLDRTAQMTLSDIGTLHGYVREVLAGDRAAYQRYAIRMARADTDQIRAVESLVADSLTNFHILKATVANLHAPDLPFEWRYEINVDGYAKSTGDLLVLRPRILGKKAISLLETKEPRRFPIEYSAPVRDTDAFEITLPAGYVIDELPAPVHLHYDFGSYDSKIESRGGVLSYARTFEFRNVEVPASRSEDLKQFYRAIAADERNSAILKRVSSSAQGPAR